MTNSLTCPFKEKSEGVGGAVRGELSRSDYLVGSIVLLSMNIFFLDMPTIFLLCDKMILVCPKKITNVFLHDALTQELFKT